MCVAAQNVFLSARILSSALLFAQSAAFTHLIRNVKRLFSALRLIAESYVSIARVKKSDILHLMALLHHIVKYFLTGQRVGKRDKKPYAGFAPDAGAPRSSTPTKIVPIVVFYFEQFFYFEDFLHFLVIH